MVRLSRRQWLPAAALLLAGCADTPTPPAAPASADPLLAPWRTLVGGFLAPPVPAFGLPARPGGGAFVKWIAPGPIALRGNDLLVADLAGGRLWRADLGAQTMSAVAGAPVGPGTALALGPDLSAWVLDAPARQLLRFARDGRLLQTVRTGSPGPSSFTLADGGATLLVADAGRAQWSELRAIGAIATEVLPRDGERRITGSEAIAAGREAVWLLDRAAGRVHRIARDGRVLASLGEGVLKQPTAIAVDRDERVFVVDAQGPALHVLNTAAPTSFSADMLRVRQIGGLSVDGRTLALADRLLGQVQLYLLRAEPAR